MKTLIQASDALKSCSFSLAITLAACGWCVAADPLGTESPRTEPAGNAAPMSSTPQPRSPAGSSSGGAVPRAQPVAAEPRQGNKADVAVPGKNSSRSSVVADFSGESPRDKTAPPDPSSPVPAEKAKGEHGGSAGTVPVGGEEKKLSFLFRFAPWELVLKRFSQEAGLTLDMNEVPPGTFNYYDNGLYTPTEALDILNGYLLPKGYILVRRDRFLVVANIERAIPPNLIPQIPLSELPRRGRNELLSVVISLDGQLDAKTAAEDVKELLGPQGKVIPLPKVNRLLVTDIGRNLSRIQELLSGLGGPSEPKNTTFRAFKLKHVIASDAERMVRELFGLPPRVTVTSNSAAVAAANAARERNNTDWRSGGGFGRRRGGWDGGGGGDFNPQPASTPAATTTPARLQLTVDSRTNSLLVTASVEDMALVDNAMKTIDVAESAEDRNHFTRRNNQPQLEVYALETADPRVVIDILNSTVPGLVIHEDAKTRRLNIYATAEDHATVRNIVRQVDSGAGETVAVLQLQKLDAVAAAASLRSLFSANKQDAPNIEADTIGRRLLVRGTTEQIGQIRKMLKELDDTGETTGPLSSDTGPYRVVSPGGRSPDEIVNLLQHMLQNDSQTTIRVVSPSAMTESQFQMHQDEGNNAGRETSPNVRRESRSPQRKPPREGAPSPAPSQRTSPAEKAPLLPIPVAPAKSSDSKKAAAKKLPSSQPVVADHSTRYSLRLVSQEHSIFPEVAFLEEKDEKADSPRESSRPAETPSGNGKRPAEVRISAFGGNIVLHSDDPAALERVEKLIESVVRVTPSRTKWTVYYLRIADASEVALMLGQLFPQGSVSSGESSGTGLMRGISSGFSALGNSLLDLSKNSSLSRSPPTLRIIPELRSNALFISGTEVQVNQVLDALKVLDSNERPESLKDRVPRMIPVEHAEVDEVAEIVKDVYRDQIEGGANPAAAARGNVNPLAMIMSGALGAQQGNRQQRAAEMTVGVDRRTNTLVVSASDPLFRQVESLVRALDSSAHEANRTVRVVNLKNANVPAVQQALGAMLTKVKVSGGNRTGTPAQSPAGTPQTPWNNNGQITDEMRNAWRQQRMMQQGMFGGGTNGGGFGRGGGEGNGSGSSRGSGGGGGFGRGGGGRGGN